MWLIAWIWAKAVLGLPTPTKYLQNKLNSYKSTYQISYEKISNV